MTLLFTDNVRQGSILGFTLFLCYKNDFYQLELANCNVLSYTNDTTLTFRDDSWEATFHRAQTGFYIVSH